MKFNFNNVAIRGIHVVVPNITRTFEDDIEGYNFSRSRSLKLKEIMGYGKHSIVDEYTSSSDLVIYGLKNLIHSGEIDINNINAIITVSQSPDFFIPALSSIIHGTFDLPRDVYCLDIIQGCAGFIVGLQNTFTLISSNQIESALLINVDILSRRVSKKDRNSYPLIGDAATICLIERLYNIEETHCILEFDGSRRDALKIEAGGFRMPSSIATAVEFEDEYGNIRSKDHLKMDGTAVFNFVQVDVPRLIHNYLSQHDININDYKALVFHQPNRFMLQKLADKLGVDHDKVPMNVVAEYGNSSGCTVPIALALNFSDILMTEKHRFLLSGFGVGLTVGIFDSYIGNLKFCNIATYGD